MIGSGKTVFVKGIAESFGIDPKDIVSPSFVFAREYKAQNITLHHIDLYKLEDSISIFDLGYDEFVADVSSVVAIEWAERIQDKYLPKNYIEIKIDILDLNKRKISIRR